MSVSAEQIDFARELFADLGPITTRRMMGGLCLYCDGTIFAILHPDGDIMLKGQGAFIAELEGAGCTQWVYTRKTGQTGAMPFWTLPNGALDDPELACDWARRALSHLRP